MPFIYEAVHNVSDVTHDPKRWETLKKEVMNEDPGARWAPEGNRVSCNFWMKFPSLGPRSCRETLTGTFDICTLYIALF